MEQAWRKHGYRSMRAVKGNLGHSLFSSLCFRRALRYTPMHEYSKSRWELGADVVGDRASALQSLQRRTLSKQDAIFRRVVPLRDVRGVRPLPLSGERQSLIPQSPATTVQE